MYSYSSWFFKEYLFLRVATRSWKVRKFDKILKHTRICMFKFTIFFNYQSLQMEKNIYKIFWSQSKIAEIFLKFTKLLIFQRLHMVQISKICFIKLQNVSFNKLNRYPTLTSCFCMLFWWYVARKLQYWIFDVCDRYTNFL